jgi:hypothetical protein
LKSLTILVLALMGLAVPGLLLAAADPVEIPVHELSFDFAGFASGLFNSAIPIFAAAIGVGLAFWIVPMLVRKFKSMGK